VGSGPFEPLPTSDIDRFWKDTVAVPIEVTAVRLYYKSPGSQQLRKNAAAELATMLAAGWQEKTRKVGVDHVVLRLERPRPIDRSMPLTSGTHPTNAKQARKNRA